MYGSRPYGINTNLFSLIIYTPNLVYLSLIQTTNPTTVSTQLKIVPFQLNRLPSTYSIAYH